MFVHRADKSLKTNKLYFWMCRHIALFLGFLRPFGSSFWIPTVFKILAAARPPLSGRALAFAAAEINTDYTSGFELPACPSMPGGWRARSASKEVLMDPA
jgi:hypothetical protein